MCSRRDGRDCSRLNKAWHQEGEDWGSSKARLGYPKGLRGNVRDMGWVRLQRALQMRMRNSNLIHKSQERGKDQNDAAREARDNQRDIFNTSQKWMVKTEDKPSHGDQGKSSEWEQRRKDEFPWDNTAKETATLGKDLNMEKERARSDMWEAAQGQHRTEVVRD